MIVGCGSIGQRHLANLRSLAPVEVVAWRQRGRDAASLRERFGLEVADTLAGALARRPDFAIVANPTALHVPVALDIARAGVSLFIEKPLSDRLDGVEALIRTVEEKGLVALVGFNLRFHAGLRLVKELLEAGRIGRVLSLRAEVGQYLPDWHPHEDYRESYSARRELGGGVILDLVHELDYARWLLGPVTEVLALAGRVSDLQIETEDVAEIVLRFETGALGSVHLDYLQRSPVRGCRLVGSEGTLAWDYLANEVRLFESRSGEWTCLSQAPRDRNDMYLAEMAHFLECVAGREKPAVTLEDGAAALELALAARRSAEAHALEPVRA